MAACTNCGAESPVKPDGRADLTGRVWWHLRGYFGINGFFCPKCYDLVRHDSYDNPIDPDGFNTVAKKQHAKCY